MIVRYHPDFPGDIRRFAADYATISPGLAARFRTEIQDAIEVIKGGPSAAGHFLKTESLIVPEFRRRNLRAFPFFILYGVTSDTLIFGSVIPTKSDPLNWLVRFGAEG